MTLADFSAALDRWGAGIAAWPEAERKAAERLLRTSAEAQDMLLEATRLETFVQANDPARALGDDALVRVINTVMANLPSASSARPTLWRQLRQWLGLSEASSEWLPRFAASMAAAAVLGLVVGGQFAADAERLSPIEALAMSNTYLPVDYR